jgi:hypothetical protein
MLNLIEEILQGSIVLVTAAALLYCSALSTPMSFYLLQFCGALVPLSYPSSVLLLTKLTITVTQSMAPQATTTTAIVLDCLSGMQYHHGPLTLIHLPFLLLHS